MLKNHRPITARLTFALATFMLAAALVACSSPRPPISQSLPNLSLGVSGFTQPRTVNELLAGVAYSEQEHLSDNVLLELDMALQDTLLTESEHSFKPLRLRVREGEGSDGSDEGGEGGLDLGFAGVLGEGEGESEGESEGEGEG